MRKAPALALAAILVASSLPGIPAYAKTKLRWYVPANYTWKTLKERFEKQNRDIQIEIIDGDLDKFYTMITAGMMPDVWGVFGTPGITAEVTRGWVQDLGPYIKRDGKAMGIDDFFPGVMAQFRVRGKQYSIPYFNYTDFYWYNTNLYSKAGLVPPPLDASDKGWNWERAIANAKKMTVLDPNSGKMKTEGIAFGRYPFAVTPTFFPMFDVKMYSEEAYKTTIPQKAYLDTPEMRKALSTVHGLIYKEKVTSTEGWAFNGTRTGSSIESGFMIKHTLPIKALKFKVAPLPWADTNSGVLWPDGWCISSYSKNKEAAWKFIKFITNPESQRFTVTDPKGAYLGSPPTRKSVFNETLGRDIGKATDMDPADVYRVHFQADAVGKVKDGEKISLHSDLTRFMDPILTRLWQNKISPVQAAVEMQTMADRRMPELFKRWLRNVKFTGKDSGVN